MTLLSREDRAAIREQLRADAAARKEAARLAKEKRLSDAVSRAKDLAAKYSVELDVLSQKLDAKAAQIKQNKKRLAAAEKALAEFASKEVVE